MIWKFSRCTIPRMVCRVVCGRVEVIATLVPTSALVSVDLPVFGRPTKHTKPERNSVIVPADDSRRATARGGVPPACGGESGNRAPPIAERAPGAIIARFFRGECTFGCHNRFPGPSVAMTTDV